MRKILLFIVVPAIILLVAVLNAVMVYKPTTSHPYTKGDSAVYIIDGVYLIQEQDSLVDCGIVVADNDGLSFQSKILSEPSNIDVKNVFCLKLDGETYYAKAVIATQVIYGIVICGMLVVFIIGFYKQVKNKNEKESS